MKVQIFMQLVRDCRSELEVRRLFLAHAPELVGTHEEIAEALQFAEDRAALLMDSMCSMAA